MKGISISFITVYRSGVIEYGIFDAGEIYVEDLVVVIKEDGSKDIKYNAL